MGLLSTGDEYNRRGDIAMLGLSNVQKVVDDLLVDTDTFREHVERLIQILHRCREHRITLNVNKFLFAKGVVDFVGYKVSRQGIEADPKKISAIRDFPVPTNVTELRSFFGLVNQLGQFSTKVSCAAEPLRPLLKKDTIFQWLPAHHEAFDAVKSALCSSPVLQPFDPLLPVELHTDAARTGGLGFALMQRMPDGTKRLVLCGSRFISESEARYAMVELELLAVAWAVNKCRMYLLGLPDFEIVVDHKPLIPLLNEKTMDLIENPRLMRLKERLLPYVFTASWRSGKLHLIADALSRAPIEDPSSEDVAAEHDLKALMCSHVSMIADHLALNDISTDPVLEWIAAAGAADPEYQELIQYVNEGCPQKKGQLAAHLLPHCKLKDDLCVVHGIVLYQSRIVIPKRERKEVLRRLHASHQGVERTKRRARQTVYWPGISSDIKNTVEVCYDC